jgi:hypothetical protein
MNRMGRTFALGLAALVLTLTGCDDFVLRTLMEGERGAAWAGPLRISPATITVLQGQSVTFTASGGGGGYTFSKVSGAGSVTPGGAYAAGASTGTEIIRVTDKVGGTAEATVSVTGGSPDYRVQATPSFPGPGPFTGNTAYSGSFVVENISSDAGMPANTITWRVYRSTDASIDPGDTVVDAGSTAALGGLAASGSIAFNGTWPSAAATWQLLVEIAASDDATAANNLSASGPITVTDAPPADVDYTVTAVNNTGGTTAGAALAGTFTFRNVGSDNGSQGVAWAVYVSADTVWDAGDTVVDADVATPLAAATTSAAIAFAGTWPSIGGSRYLVVKVTASDDIAPGNNTGSSAVVTVATAPVDYDVLTVVNTGGTVAGAAVAGQFQIRNIGTAAGGQTVHWTAYVSSNATLDGADPVVDADTTTALGAGATSAFIPFNGSWPSVSGTWYLIVKVTAADDVAAANDEQASGGIAITGTAPPDVDYDLLTVSYTGGTVGGGPISGEFTAQNIGTAAGSQTVYWTAYVSSDATLGGGDSVLDAGSFGQLAAGGLTGTIAFTGTWPLTGPRYLIVQLAAADDIAVANNVQPSGAVALTAAPVNYTVTSVSHTGGFTAGGALTGTFTLQNAGTAAGTRTVYWDAYVSTDATLGAGDTPIANGSTAALAAFGSAGPIAFAGVWPTTPGSYYLLVHLTTEDDIDGANNTGATGSSVAVAAPNINYQVNSVVNIAPAYTGSTLHGQVQIQNIGTVAGSATLYWTAYRSLDATLQIGTDVVVDAGSSAALAASGITNVDFYDAAWPSSLGTWYLIVSVTASDDPAAGNNTLASSSIALAYPPINYQVNSVTNVGPTLTGGQLHGQFQLQNIGTLAGTSGVSWTAYRSLDTTLQIGTDLVVDAGMTSALGPAASTTIDFYDTWPSAAGSWYLIVDITAADDTTTGNNRLASANVPITGPPVDYRVLSVTNTGGVYTGQALGGQFQLQNAGTSAGTQTVYWTAYRSLNNTLEVGTDPVIDSGTWAALGAGASQAINFSSTWPGTSGTWYLIVRALASDDVTPGNETFTSAAIPIGPPPAPDYSVLSPSFGTSVPWSDLINSTIDGAPQFTIQNLSANAGTSTIYWYVYRSTDKVLDGADVLVTQGNTGFLGGGGSTIVPFSGNWPAGLAGGFYYLILKITAADDVTPSNDTVVSHPIGVGSSRYQEAGDAPGGVGPNPPAGQTVNTGLTLLPNQTFVIEGTMDAATEYDTYRWTDGAGNTRMSAAVKWETGFDDIDLFFWSTSGSVEFFSSGYATDGEPGGNGFLELTGLTPTSTYYLSPWFYLYGNTSGSTGQKYVVIVNGLP